MRIKMLTTRLGSDTENNWSEGQVFNVPPSIALEKEQLRQAVALDPYPSEHAVITPPEKAVVTPVEKAVVTPPETAVGHKTVSAVLKAATAKPAPSEPEVKIELPKPSWGKGGAK